MNKYEDIDGNPCPLSPLEEAWEEVSEATKRAMELERQKIRQELAESDWPKLYSDAEMAQTLIDLGCPRNIANEISEHYGFGIQIAFRRGLEMGSGHMRNFNEGPICP